MKFIMPTALIVGSAPISTNLSNINLDDTLRIAVNNAWLLRKDFHYSIYPDDFPEERRPDSSIKHISSEKYMPSFNAAGGITFGGATMSLAAGYWAVYKKHPWILGFYGCDMVYSQTQSHFYGEGKADPLRDDISLRSLDAKTARLFLHALYNGTVCINYSSVKGTRLIFPQIPLEHRPCTLLDAYKLRRRIVKSIQYKKLMKIFAQCKKMEQCAPFSSLITNYWINSSEASVNYIDKVDAEWLQSAEIIRDLLK